MKTQPVSPPETPLPVPFYLRKYGVSRTTFWRWEKLGLPVMQVGAKKFVLESEFLRFLKSRGNRETVLRQNPCPCAYCRTRAGRVVFLDVRRLALPSSHAPRQLECCLA